MSEPYYRPATTEEADAGLAEWHTGIGLIPIEIDNEAAYLAYHRSWGKKESRGVDPRHLSAVDAAVAAAIGDTDEGLEASKYYFDRAAIGDDDE